MKNCITQINASERAFNQVTRKTIRVQDTITYQTTETQYTTTEQGTAYNKTYRNQAQPLTQIIAFDPTGNLYSLINTALGCSVSKFALGDLSQNTVTGAIFARPTDVNNATLITANMFWSSGTLVFIGVFYKTNTIIKIYTFDTALAATNRLSISLAGTKQYTGQCTYNSGNSGSYIYIVLCPPPQFGFELAPIYYVKQSNWTYLNTNMLFSFSSIQQADGDTLGGAIVSSYSQTGIYISYVSGATVSWRNTLAIPTAASTPCAIVVMNNTPVLSNPTGNYILAFFFDGTNFQTQLFSYTSTAPTLLTSNPQVGITWPFNTPYTVQSMSLSYKVGENTGEPRFFYTMYLYNLNVTNYEYYIQNGEIDAGGNILSFSNIQIGPSYNVSPSNNIQSSSNLTAVSSGEELITYATTYQQPFTAIVERQAQRDFCQTVIVYPGCDCPTVPANSLFPSVDGLTHTLQIAVCEPQTFTNPSAIVSCAPVNTPPTKYLTQAQGAEPPQGPANNTVTRRYYNISGIDQICRPIPNRFSSSKTARIRTGIESASDTQYATTVLPVVTYPFPCPVYGNQAGIPVASLCRPMIDGRPTNGVPS